jgi:hypothetical protein
MKLLDNIYHLLQFPNQLLPCQEQMLRKLQ